ncbi:hypothetical protein ACFSR9_09280 [Deinococcus taklimakanensis]|uniref:DUF2975 domain-containing protein n=1 Tax=Deinococcus taklimakanensis TaxID=536443 RepID=A0ABW5P2U5_9DEIO
MTLAPTPTPRPELQRRTQTLQGLLGQMAALNVAGLILTILAAAGLLSFISSADLGGPVVWLWLLPTAVYLSFLRAAQRAVGSAGEYARTRVAPPTLLDDTNRMAAWLRALQILAVLGALLSMAVNFAVPGVSEELRPADGPRTVIYAAIPTLISLVLAWLMYEAFRRFFVAVRDHAAGQGTAVLPAARSASGWMMFLYIVQWIAVAFLLMGAVAVLVITLAGGGALLPSIGPLEWLVGLATAAFLVWAISLGVRFYGYASRFATEVGEALTP